MFCLVCCLHVLLRSSIPKVIGLRSIRVHMEQISQTIIRNKVCFWQAVHESTVWKITQGLKTTGWKQLQAKRMDT